MCIEARFDTYHIPFFSYRKKKEDLKMCTEHSVALDARART